MATAAASKREGGHELNAVDVQDGRVVLGVAYSGGADGGGNNVAKQDNPEGVSVRSAGERRNTVGLAGVHFEEVGGFSAVAVVKAALLMMAALDTELKAFRASTEIDHESVSWRNLAHRVFSSTLPLTFTPK